MNQLTDIAAKIEALIPGESSLEHWKFDGVAEKDGQHTKEYFGEFCTPDEIDNLKAIAAEVKRLTEENARLREGLEHYADKDSWERDRSRQFDLYSPNADGYDHARKILDEIARLEGGRKCRNSNAVIESAK